MAFSKRRCCDHAITRITPKRPDTSHRPTPPHPTYTHCSSRNKPNNHAGFGGAVRAGLRGLWDRQGGHSAVSGSGRGKGKSPVWEGIGGRSRRRLLSVAGWMGRFGTRARYCMGRSSMLRGGTTMTERPTTQPLKRHRPPQCQVGGPRAALHHPGASAAVGRQHPAAPGACVPKSCAVGRTLGAVKGPPPSPPLPHPPCALCDAAPARRWIGGGSPSSLHNNNGVTAKSQNIMTNPTPNVAQADVLACVQKYIPVTPEQAVSIQGACVRPLLIRHKSAEIGLTDRGWVDGFKRCECR